MSCFCKSDSSDYDRVLCHLTNDNFEYRTIDGSGNNIDNPTWGQAGTEFLRIGGPYYSDNISQPSVGPNAREISNIVFDQDESIPNSKNLSAYFWLFGQFIDHDITLVTEGDEPFNIQVPTGDPYFDPLSTGTQIIPFHRTQGATGTGTDPSNPRQHINNLSSYIDASNVYGNSEERNKYMRLFKDGLLLTTNDHLPPINNGTQNNAGSSLKGLFVCGDVRSNEHLGLTSLHTLFVREHNYWARQIKKFNFKHSCKELSDEEIYQRAKIMVEAEIQCITYRDFIPELLGNNNLFKKMDYDNTINTQIVQSFAVAAYRLGHSLVSSKIERLNKCGKPIYEGNTLLRDIFFCPSKLCNEGGIEPILRGFANVASEELDAKVINDLRNFLFGEPGQGGLDLAALNIQRGRDHAIPNFAQARSDLGLPPKTVISSDPAVNQSLIDAYGPGLNGCDLWVCGLAEDKINNNALLGETFATIVEDQFSRIKRGDRFWYQNRLPSVIVELIEKTTLTDIILRNTSIKNIQKDVFHLPGECN